MSATALPDQLSDAARAFVSRDFGAAADGRTFDSVDPATGEVIATLPLGGRAEVDAAVAAAQAAFAQGPRGRRPRGVGSRGRPARAAGGGPRPRPRGGGGPPRGEGGGGAGARAPAPAPPPASGAWSGPTGRGSHRWGRSTRAGG